jgi:Macrocin-O-methyltransferase (TylF)
MRVHLSGLSHAERTVKIRRGVRRRVQLFAGRAVYYTIAYLINRSRESPIIVDYRPDFHYIFDELLEYRDLFRSWTRGNNTNNCGDLTRFYGLYRNVQNILADGIPGDLVEIGVYRGNSARLLAVLARRARRRLYLFDTFSGFHERNLRGTDSDKKISFKNTSLERVKRLVNLDNVVYVPGVFPDSVSTIELPEQFAVVHLDCDLYEPTKAGLEEFYSHVSPGGLVIVHDYGSGHWPGVRMAVDQFLSGRPERPILLSDKSGTALIRKV